MTERNAAILTGESADMLFSKDKELLDRADLLLARSNNSSNSGGKGTEEIATESFVDDNATMSSNTESKHDVAPFTQPVLSVRLSLTPQQRRTLVHNHLKYKWSTTSSQAAIIKAGTRKVMVSPPKRASKKTTFPTKDRSVQYSGWCPLCKMRKEWCGFSHESLGLDQTSAKNNGGGSGKKTSLGWSLSEYGAKVKRKASKRRGNKMAAQWKQGQVQRAAAQHWNQRRLCRGEEQARDKEMEVMEVVEDTSMEEEVQDVRTASEGGDS